MKKLKVLDLFSGIGGFSLGLERTGGFETIVFCEQDKHCNKVLNKHWPNIPIARNIEELYFDTEWDGHCDIIGNCLRDKELCGEESIIYKPQNYFENIDVITGGFPCQDISFAGARNGIKAERSGLWAEYHRLIDEIRPKYAIIENVEYLRKNGLGVVLNDLAGIGYDAEWACIPARAVGYPHQRKRLFIISYPSGQRQYEYIGEERHVQINSEWESASLYDQGKQCESEFIQVRPILSKGTFDNIRDTYPNERTAVSELCRVTDGISKGLDETRRKQRIKQLGNAIVPRIAEIIGKAILEHERSLHEYAG